MDPFVAPERTRRTGAPWPHTEGAVSQGPDAAQAADETGQGTLRASDGGLIKQGRGFRQFLLRGLAKVNREWLIICAGHNLLKLFRYGAGMFEARGKGSGRREAPAGPFKKAGQRSSQYS